ncbi:MAG: alpha/beta fold hydrolase [Chloroflexi bacterium]|nr:alpha/beta fold hydrolase [Chloroflexota bacterium]
MPKALANGVNLYYEEHGSGLPFLLLHGFAGTTAMWKTQVPALSQRCRFITYDMRGHGQSDAPADPERYSMPLAVEDQHQLLRHLGVRQGIIGGLSLGGVVAMNFYLGHPEMCKALILCDTGPGYRNPGRHAQWQAVRRQVSKLLEEGGIEAFLQSPHARDDYYTTPDLMRRHNPIGLSNVNKRVMYDVPMLPIEAIKVPTLIICGTRDGNFIAPSLYMHQHIPGAQLAFLPGAGHGSNVDQPEMFNKVVLDWLAEVGIT